MKILVSACLLGEKCKYSGGDNLDKELKDILKDHEVLAVCPEVMGGLPIPRECVEIREGKAYTKSGLDKTREFTLGAERALNAARDFNPDYVVLQPRSPSCGKGRIYDGTFSSSLIEGNGMTAQLLMDNGFKVLLPMDFKEIASSPLDKRVKESLTDYSFI